jgi:S1-C subfamily serine protease
VSTNPEPELKITLGPTRVVSLPTDSASSHARAEASAPPPATRFGTKRMVAVTSALAAAFLLAIGIAVGIQMARSDGGGVDPTMKGKPRAGSSVGLSGLSEEESRLSTIYMEGHWLEEDALVDDEASWNCSGVVVAEEGDSLIIMTNSHCIGLDGLVKADLGAPEIKRFTLGVAMWGSRDRIKVTRFAECDSMGMDVALLHIPKGRMRHGRDFVVAPISGRHEATVGRDVVAIGAPRGLRGTETFGRISALRKKGELLPHEVLQTDTAINPGNSGGPLFLVIDERRHLIGLSTFGIGGEGLNFAFYADEFPQQSWQWFDATPAGASAALRAVYNIDSVVVP